MKVFICDVALVAVMKTLFQMIKYYSDVRGQFF